MPFVEIDVQAEIQKRLDADPEFKVAWESSRAEYRVLGELIKLRKQQGFTQSDLADKTGNKQQVISRIENKENSPTLKTLCSILDVLGYDIQFVPRTKV